MNANETLSIKGHLEITTTDISTGEVIDTFSEDNIYLNQGKEQLLKAFTTPDSNLFNVKTVVIGDDVGTGTVLLPEAPSATYTELNQAEVYSVPVENFFATYPTSNSVRFSSTISGDVVMQSYTGQPNVIYTSATLVTTDNKAISYRRFPARTISSLISVSIAWTITIV
jgi:hypothetical protein